MADLGMNCVVAKFILWLLSKQQKEFRTEIAQDLLETSNNDPDFLKQVITGDESWVYGYNPETRAQSSQWKSPESPCPKKVRQSQSNVKTMLTVFFYRKSVVHHQYTPPDLTSNKE
jgi:hypothetical protein